MHYETGLYSVGCKEKIAVNEAVYILKYNSSCYATGVALVYTKSIPC